MMEAASYLLESEVGGLVAVDGGGLVAGVRDTLVRLVDGPEDASGQKSRIRMLNVLGQ